MNSKLLLFSAALMVTGNTTVNTKEKRFKY